MYHLTKFDDLTMPMDNPTTDHSPPVAVRSVIRTAGGAFDRFGSDRAPASFPYTLRHRATIYESDSSTQLTTMDNWRRKVGVRASLWRAADATGDLQYATARLEAVRVNRQPKHTVYQPVEWLFTVLGPWNGQTLHSMVMRPTTDGTPRLPRMWANTAGATPKFSIYNAGTTNQTEMTFTLAATGAGSLSNVTITNNTTGHQMTFSGTIASGDSLVIDTGALTVTNGGSNAYSSFTWNRPEWMVLEPGWNRFSISVTGSDGKLTVTWRDAYA